MSASILAGHLHPSVQMPLNRFKQDSPTLSVSPTQSTEMALIGSVVDKLSEGLLFKSGRVDICQPLCRHEGWQYGRRYNKITNAQGRKDCARESPDINCAAVVVESLKRFKMPIIVAKFSVVIILDNNRVATASPIEQSEPTL